jgi:hypothetical protein
VVVGTTRGQGVSHFTYLEVSEFRVGVLNHTTNRTRIDGDQVNDRTSDPVTRTACQPAGRDLQP